MGPGPKGGAGKSPDGPEARPGRGARTRPGPAARGRGLRPEKPGVDALDLGTVATLDIKLVDTDIAAALRSLFKPPWGSSAGQLAHLLVARAAWTALFAARAALRLLVGAVTLSWLRWGGGGRGSGLNYDL